MIESKQKIQIWCSNCQLRDFNIESGVVCSITGKKPSFHESCSDIVIDEERSKENDFNYIFEKYDKFLPSVKVTKLNYWMSIFYRRKLNIEEVIYESFFEQLKPALIIALSFFIGIMMLNYKSLGIWTFIVTTVLLFLIFVIIKFSKQIKCKGKILFVLSRNGIEFDNLKFYKWNEIQTFFKHVSKGKSLLIIKKPLEVEEVVELNTWRVSISKIEYLIEKYKQEYIG